MRTIIIDDNQESQQTLYAALSEIPVISDLRSFSSCSDAMQYMQSNTPDLVFMESVIENCSAMSIADSILKQYPGCKLVFCTSFPYFALDAFRIHASGYLLKPITAQTLLAEIERLFEGGSPYLMEAHCFGHFEATVHDEPLPFRRSKTKELLALLIDRNGAGITSRQICSYLWESDQQKDVNYFYQLLDDLRNTLEEAGAKQILVKIGNRYAVDTKRIDCDYYSYLKTGRPLFYGEYMTQFSWAEDTCASLWQNMLGQGKN